MSNVKDLTGIVRKLPFLPLMRLMILMGISFGCTNREIRLSSTVPEIDKTREAKILTAFFGLDNALTQRARALYWNAPGKDGMPIVFSLEVDPFTLDAADFEVTTKDGTTFDVEAFPYLASC